MPQNSMETIKWPKYPSTTTFCPMKDTDNHDTLSAELKRSKSENLLVPWLTSSQKCHGESKTENTMSKFGHWRKLGDCKIIFF